VMSRIETASSWTALAFMLGATAALVSPPLAAASFCVGNSTELNQALNAAQLNGEDDDIRIRVGDYPTNNPSVQTDGEFTHNMEGGFDLTLSGGWSDFNGIPCLINLADPDETTLDGLGTNGVLEVRGSADSSGRVTIRNLSIVRAQVDQFSSGLYLSMPSSEFSGEVLIERVQFSGNQGQQGSALRVIGGDKVTVRNSVFVFNRSENGKGVASIAGGDIRLYFINNTFMYNFHDLPSAGANDASALYFGFSLPGTLPQVLVANNLFWANDTPDLYTSVSGIFHLYNNNLLQRVGQADFEAGNLSVDPQLVNAPLDFTPALGSPMIDQGYPEPTPPIPFPPPFLSDWSHGSGDHYNSVVGRVYGNSVDIGAVESPFLDSIFSDRFKSP